MDLDAKTKAEIDSLSYAALLTAWRFTPVGDPIMQGESGAYWAERMRTLRDQPGGDPLHVAVSKAIGWR